MAFRNSKHKIHISDKSYNPLEVEFSHTPGIFKILLNASNLSNNLHKE